MDDPPLEEFADNLNNLIPVIMREFARRQANELYRGKITLPQLLVLEFLSREKEARMTDLAHFMSVTTAAMTGIADRLVRYGYVVRETSARDRRIIKIKLTQKGSGLVKKINRQRRQMYIKIFGRISESGRSQYLKILEQIKDILTRENSGAK